MPNEKKSILQPKNDVVFKALFSRGKTRITQAMLEAILKMKIDRLELDKSTDLLNDNKDDKNGRLDLRAVINGNTECDIEVQLASNDNISERFVYYWAKMYAANLKIGDKYSNLRKTISIIILDDTFKLTAFEICSIGILSLCKFFIISFFSFSACCAFFCASSNSFFICNCFILFL